MERFFKYGLMALGVACLCVLATVHKGQARLTGTNPTGGSADTWCVGRASYEVCVDSSGNVVPTTNNNQSSGTSAMRWSNVFTTLANVSGVATVGTVTGSTLTASTQFVLPNISSTNLNAITVLSTGAVYMVVTDLAAPWAICHATGSPKGSVVISSAPTVQCRQN